MVKKKRCTFQRGMDFIEMSSMCLSDVIRNVYKLASYIFPLRTWV